MLNAWRATQADQQGVGKSLIETLENSQVGGDCNRLITGLRKSACTIEKKLGKISLTLKYQFQ